MAGDRAARHSQIKFSAHAIYLLRKNFYSVQIGAEQDAELIAVVRATSDARLAAANDRKWFFFKGEIRSRKNIVGILLAMAIAGRSSPGFSTEDT